MPTSERERSYERDKSHESERSSCYQLRGRKRERSRRFEISYGEITRYAEDDYAMQQGESYADNGEVWDIQSWGGEVSGKMHGHSTNQIYQMWIRRSSRHYGLRFSCTCPSWRNTRRSMCTHTVALGVEVAARQEYYRKRRMCWLKDWRKIQERDRSRENSTHRGRGEVKFARPGHCAMDTVESDGSYTSPSPSRERDSEGWSPPRKEKKEPVVEIKSHQREVVFGSYNEARISSESFRSPSTNFQSVQRSSSAKPISWLSESELSPEPVSYGESTSEPISYGESSVASEPDIDSESTNELAPRSGHSDYMLKLRKQLLNQYKGGNEHQMGN